MRQTAGPAESILESARRAEAELVDQLLRLTAVDAPSGDQLSLRAAADPFAEELGELGGEVTWHTMGGITHLSTRLGPPEGAHVLILCHYDTVWPRGTAAERPGRVTGERLSGPGCFDMRGGIVAALGRARRATPVRAPRSSRRSSPGVKFSGRRHAVAAR